MYYTSIIAILVLVLSGCSPMQSNSTNLPTTSSSNSDTSISEIENYQQAITLLNSNQLDSAESLLLEFTESRPELAGPWANLGLIYIKRENFKQAHNYLDKALEKNPALPQALNLSGLIAYQQGNIKQAEQLYKKAIEQKKDYAIAHYNLALLYDIYFQDFGLALPHYEKYLKLVDNPDKETLDWVEQIRNSLRKNQR